jgi:hypothetical protein
MKSESCTMCPATGPLVRSFIRHPPKGASYARADPPRPEANCVMELTAGAPGPTFLANDMPRTRATTTPAGSIAMRGIRICVGACPAG